MILTLSEWNASSTLALNLSDEEFGRVGPLGPDEAEIAGLLGDPPPTWLAGMPVM